MLLERDLIRALRRARLTLAAAESLTGGLLMERLTRVPGAADVLRGGFVTYVDGTKRVLLDVDARILREEGAVHPAVAAQMAEGVRKALGADLGVSLTGVAGPQVPPGLAKGLVFLGLADGEATTVIERRYRGGRGAVREQAARDALEMALARARS